MLWEVSMRYEAVVIGTSAGGLNALRQVLEQLTEKFPVPIIIVQHMSPNSPSILPEYLGKHCSIRVKEADEKEWLNASCAYIAPPNYHLLIEQDRSLSLTVAEKVCYSRPSIDVLFETAADVYREKLIGVILTGANRDGSLGLKKIKEYGGLTIVQDPLSAEVDTMPNAAIAATAVDYILSLDRIGIFLNRIMGDIRRGEQS